MNYDFLYLFICLFLAHPILGSLHVCMSTFCCVAPRSIVIHSFHLRQKPPAQFIWEKSELLRSSYHIKYIYRNTYTIHIQKKKRINYHFMWSPNNNQMPHWFTFGTVLMKGISIYFDVFLFWLLLMLLKWYHNLLCKQSTCTECMPMPRAGRRRARPRDIELWIHLYCCVIHSMPKFSCYNSIKTNKR